MADDLDALLARVRRLEDLEAVRATWLDYCNRLDLADFEALGDVFTEDATLEMDGLGPGLDGGAIVWEAQDGLNTLENKAVFTQGLYGELAHFCEAILASRPATIGSLEFALELTRVYEGALLSEGSPVQIKQGQ